jgi:predicted NBD/HSP70 family sugar kinase
MYVGYVVAALCNAVNPSTVVLGGQLAAAGAPLADGVRDAMARHVSAEESTATVVLGELGDRAAVLGALALVIGDTDRLGSAGLPALTPPPIQGGLLT